MILLMIDITRIQSYVFNSNRLRDNIGASHLAAQAVTTAFPGSLLDAALTDVKGASRIVYAGGGNAMLLLPDGPALRQVVAALSRASLRVAPGLTLAYGWAELEGDGADAFTAANRRAFARLDEHKRALQPPLPLSGLGVTAQCAATRLPAVGMTRPIGETERPVLAAAEVLAKEDVWRAAHDQLLRTQPLDGDPAMAGRSYRLDYPTDFDNLGRSEGEASYIAVVHADGNGMGKRIEALLARGYATIDDCVAALSDFSSTVQAAMQAALNAVITRLHRSIEVDPELGQLVVRAAPGATTTVRLKQAQRAGKLSRQDAPYFLPLRPLIAAGDEVTFVCDGRLGLELAVTYLETFGRHKDSDGEPFSACAGVTILNAHYPFAQAYALSEELCAEAKRYRRRIGAKGACLDWHISATGLGGTIEHIRRREYTIRPGGDVLHLELRPVTLGDNHMDPLRSWKVVRDGLTSFQAERWQGRRSKAKALREALRRGPDAVRTFHTLYRDGAPLDPVGVDENEEVAQTGFYGDRCAYFDALELADLYVEPVMSDAGGQDGT